MPHNTTSLRDLTILSVLFADPHVKRFTLYKIPSISSNFLYTLRTFCTCKSSLLTLSPWPLLMISITRPKVFYWDCYCPQSFLVNVSDEFDLSSAGDRMICIHGYTLTNGTDAITDCQITFTVSFKTTGLRDNPSASPLRCPLL